MKVYSYQEMLKFKERCYRGDAFTFGSISEYGCGIPIYYNLNNPEIYKLVCMYVYENVVLKNHENLSMLNKIFKNNQEYFQKFLGEKIYETI